MNYLHIPVMLHEALEALNLNPHSTVADVTVGMGGHLQKIAESVTSGKIIATDRDLAAIKFCKTHYKNSEFSQTKFICTKFSQLSNLIPEKILFEGLIADLGISSFQLNNKERGFSFKNDGPLDMRMNNEDFMTAYELINNSTEKNLANIIYEYGNERFSRRIAKAIKKNKNIPNSCLALADIIANACGNKRQKIHPATRTFQALRIAVNDELHELQTLLNQLEFIIKPGGRVVIITFHSLEDRIVKHFFKNNRKLWNPVYKKPLIPKKAEIDKNPRARSAKLRSVEKIA